MGIKIEVVESTYTLHDEEEFLYGTIVGAEEVPPNKYPNPQIKWIIQLDDDPEGQTVWYYTPTVITNSDRNKLRKMYRALMGEDPDVGEAFDSDDFVGRRVKVMFERYEADGTEKERIIALKAAK